MEGSNPDNPANPGVTPNEFLRHLITPPAKEAADIAQPLDGALNSSLANILEVLDNNPTLKPEELKNNILLAAKQEDEEFGQVSVGQSTPTDKTELFHIISTTELFDPRKEITIPLTIADFTKLIGDLQGKGIPVQRIDKLTSRFARMYRTMDKQQP